MVLKTKLLALYIFITYKRSVCRTLITRFFKISVLDHKNDFIQHFFCESNYI